MDLVHEIDRAQETFDATIDELARIAWRDIIDPLCQKHRLQYMAGNGLTTFFANYKGEVVYIGSAYGAENDHHGSFAYLVPIFRDVIDLELSDNDCLGYHIPDSNYLVTK
jgi:hypothetical protein